MTGMGGSLSSQNTVVTQHFERLLFEQLLIALILVAAAGAIGALWFRRAQQDNLTEVAEPSGRRLLRIGFGIIWIIDGLLQLQVQMPIGMPTQVVAPTAASAPGWLASLVTSGVDAWLRHPITAAVATVWIQVGIGCWLLIARRGRWSQAAGVAAAAWGLGVWIFGNSLGGLFMAPISWMTGAPGAVAFYVVAGVLIALPDRVVASKSTMTWVTRAMGALILYFGILQAWPGRGFWSGGTASSPGAIPAMAQNMGSVSQPGFAASIQHWFASTTLSYSWLYNAVVVVVLLGVGAAYLSRRPQFLRPASWVYLAACVINWVLVQDFGVFGGMGTDLNSMIPWGLCALGIAKLSIAADEAVEVPEVTLDMAASERARLRQVGSLAALFVFAFGAIPMLLLPILPGATADAAVASGAQVTPLAGPAPSFTLMNQNNQTVSLASLKGRAVVLGFLDPVCTNDCPVEAHEFEAAAAALPASTIFIAVDVNPLYLSTASLRTFIANEGLSSFKNFDYVTGTIPELNKVWSKYGVDVQIAANGSMVAHTEPVYVIGPNGNLAATWAVQTGANASNPVGQSSTSILISQVKAAS